MKQVNRKFLEKQVQIALKEQKEDKWGDTGGEMAADVILGIPFGSPSSYIDLKNYFKNIGMHGFGPDAAYKRALDERGNIEKAGSRAPFSQLMLRFYKTLPVKGDEASSFDPTTLNLTPNEELAAELVDVKKYGYSKILPILKAGDKSKVSKVEKILRIMAHRNALSTLDESLEDIAETYGFIESDLTTAFSYTLYGSFMKFSQVTLFKDPDALEKAGMYKEFAKDIIAAGTGKLGDSLEKFIMFHFNGLEDANFRKAMVRLQVRSNLPKVAKAYMSFMAYSEGGLSAAISAADILLSTVTTIAFVAGAAATPFTMGASAGVSAGALATRVAAMTGIKALRSLIAKGALKHANTGLVKAAVNLGKAEGAAGKTLQFLAAAPAQFTPLYILAGELATEGFFDWYHDLERNNKVFLTKYADKSEEERIRFFQEDIKPSFMKLAKAHMDLMKEAGFDPKYLSTRVEDVNNVQQAYAMFDKKSILQLKNNIEETTRNINELAAKLMQNEEQLKKVG